MENAAPDPPQPAIEYGRPASAYADRPPKPRGDKIVWWVVGIVTILLLVTLLIPSLNRPHVSTLTGKCLSNLHQIGLGMCLYANNFNGNYPDDFGQLLANEKLTTDVFVCPASNDTPATQPADLFAGGHCSYVYLGRGLTEKTVKPTDVLAYDPPGNHDPDYRILLGDLHSETVKAPRGAKLVAAAEAAMKARLQSATTKP